MYELKEYLKAINQTKEPLMDGDDEEWELEKILDKRTLRKKTEYLVQFKGFPLYRDMQWRPEAELTELAPKLLKDFQTEFKKSEAMS